MQDLFMCGCGMEWVVYELCANYPFVFPIQTCNQCRKRTSQQKWLQIEKFPQVLVLRILLLITLNEIYLLVG